MQEKSKAVFLDRDGTINVEKNYLYKIEDFEFLPDVVEGMKKLSDAGYKLIVVTNQSGIARGFYTEEDYEKLNSWMVKKLSEFGVEITATYFCPHLPDASIEKYKVDCQCRKPETALFEKAVLEHNIDLAKSFAIGDKIRDLAICEKTECRGFLVGENEDGDVMERAKAGGYRNVLYKENFGECVEEILRRL